MQAGSATPQTERPEKQLSSAKLTFLPRHPPAICGHHWTEPRMLTCGVYDAHGGRQWLFVRKF